MSSSHIFISHASKDDSFVKELRLALEGHGLTVWIDSRNLRGGGKLAPEIAQAIEQAGQIIVVLSPHTINSPWVRQEIRQALAVEQTRRDQGYRVIPLLLPGVEPSALALWFDEEPVGIRVELKTGSISEALPQILAALGERLPDDSPSAPAPPATPPVTSVAELILKLSRPQLDLSDGKRRATAEAQLVYEPSERANRNVESDPFSFTAPIGPIEADDLRWYLEEFYRWPSKTFQARAKGIEKQLPEWGRLLFAEAVKDDSAKEALEAWRGVGSDVARRFSVMVDDRLMKGSSEEQQT
ncbi:MAG: toll/interleukin-1 receptor domain-containing protein, partial [Acidobacteriota bacterium]|nr:toll/interleukin-1 receptor domain-containing protein [Acidobacteriota bacterium]